MRKISANFFWIHEILEQETIRWILPARSLFYYSLIVKVLFAIGLGRVRRQMFIFFFVASWVSGAETGSLEQTDIKPGIETSYNRGRLTKRQNVNVNGGESVKIGIRF